MSERLVKRTLNWSIGYLGTSYGPGEVMVPLGLAQQLGPPSPDDDVVPQADPQPETPESRKERLAQLEAEVEQLRAEVAADEEDAEDPDDSDDSEDDDSGDFDESDEGDGSDHASAGDGSVTPLPEEFVNKTVRELLVTNGFTTVEKVADADDEELLALDGIADGRLKEIRDAVTALQAPQPQE